MNDKIWYRDIKIIMAVRDGYDSIPKLSKKENLSLSRSSTTLIVKRLVKYGLLTMDPDHIITVTNLGKTLAAEIKGTPVLKYSENLGYRIENKNDRIQVYPVFHGTVSPGFKIDIISVSPGSLPIA